MDRNDFGQLVAALRKEVFDEDGNRLTQKELANRIAAERPATALTEVVIGKIERGERANLEADSLQDLADALNLTMGERHTFFLLGIGLDHPQIHPAFASEPALLDGVLQMLADIQIPALLLDHYLDIVAVNRAVLQLYQLPSSLITQLQNLPTNLNLLTFIFSPLFQAVRAEMPADSWHRFAVGNVIYFRRVSLPYRMTPYYESLLKELRRNREFRFFWEQALYEEKLNFVGGESFARQSTEVGRLRYLTAPLVTLTPYGNLEIVAHIPRDAATATAFSQYDYENEPKVLVVSSWPDKLERLS
ncbi:MAG: hypothetical protein KDE09_17850 [Anaerolineales bacterium]|nr:hypothetical protein [Anaerolineales bacterium]MCB0028893.1 hypothetical protein [Anaerolineales bacterium]